MVFDMDSPEGLPSDDVLIQAVATGDRGALRDLVRRHQEAVRRIACQFLRDQHLADDVAQDVFLRVHAAAGRYKAQGRFPGWLRRITVNLCRDRLRKIKRSPVSLHVVADPSAEPRPDGLEQQETIQRIRRAVDALPERQRTALLLHRYQGLSHDDVAEATGWSRSAVESLIVRAYAKLRQVLADLK